MAHVHVRDKAASLALQEDVLLLDLHRGLGVSAGVALHIALDEALQQLRELVRLVGAIDNASAALGVVVGLGAELAAKVFEDVCDTVGCVDRLETAVQRWSGL